MVLKMKGGNGANAVSEVTLCSKGEIPYCVSRKRPLDGACLGRQLDGFAGGEAPLPIRADKVGS